MLGCGGGGSSTGGNALPQTSAPPTVTLEGWTPGDAQLLQYKAYTFSASGTDPNLGGSITELQWNLGDGTTKVTPVVLANGKATASLTYAYTSSGSLDLSVVAKNGAGLLSKAVTKSLSITAAPSPLTVTFTNPATAVSINPALGSSYALTFQIHVVNTGSGTISASGIHFDAGDPAATVATPVDLGNGDWRIVVTYSAASALGSRTATPTVKVYDSNLSSSDLVTGPAVTVRTVSTVDNPPVITMVATPRLVAGENSTWQGIAIDFKATATDPDGDTLSYSWTFGEGGKGDVAPTLAATALAQSHTYAAKGIYPVVFKADDGRAGGVKTITLNLNILPNSAPVLSIVQAPAGQTYANVPLSFTAVVSDADGDVPAISWDFGDTTSGKDSPILHTFLASGATVITATADDGKGGVSTKSITVNVLPNRAPVSSVATPPGSLYQNRAYTFTAQAADPDAGDTVAQYQWDFGDGTGLQTSAAATISHTFASTYTGTAQVKVRAVDNHGSVGDFSQVALFPVVATSLPTGAFLNPLGAAAYNTESGSAGVAITYIVSMTNPNGTGFLPLSALTFDAGEGSATATLLSQTNNGNGTYTYQVQYKPDPKGVGTRVVTPTLVATDLQGILGLVKAGGPVTINTQAANTPPVIGLSTSALPSAGTNASWQGVAFTFSGTATDADKDPMTYTLSFGDAGGAGDVAATPVGLGGTITATHSYAAAGVYTAKLTVTDGRTNGAKTITLNINVLANAAPVVSITNTPVGATQFANVPLTFTATVTDANADPTALTWDFGDGSALVQNQNPVTHSFVAAGTTVVRATADDGKGGVTTASMVLSIQPNRAPVSSLSTPAASLYQNKVYTFTASATDPDAGDSITQYQWDFGDKTGILTSTLNTLDHTFAPTFTGAATVLVRAVDSHGSVGDFSPAVTFQVVATPLPLTTLVNQGTNILNVDVGGTVEQSFTITATNPRAGTPGVTDPIPAGNITFLTNDPAATYTLVSNGGGTYTATVRYTATALTRTSTPTVFATDSLGIQGPTTTGPLMTIRVLGVNHAPSITITDPASPISSGYTSKPVSLGFTLKDADNDTVTYTVNWGDGSPTTGGVPQGDFVAGVPVSLTHVYADAFTASTRAAFVTVDATDNRSTTPNASTQTRTFSIAFNALPTASITSPQDSGSAPAGYTPNPLPPDTVVVPLNSKLSFAGISTKPGSQDAVSSAWDFSIGGTPSTFSGDKPGEIFFTGTAGVITPYTITFTVTDTFGRTATKQKTVLVDGVNTQLFHLSFVYRQKSDNNGASLLNPVATVANGLGATVQIFQDHQTNSYAVQNQSLPVGAKALVDIPVRSDLPFYIKVPSFGSDSISYLMRIPNAPTGPYADPTLGATPGADSTFTFRNASAPFEPALQIVTAQGFAAESSAAPQRKLNGFTNLVIGASPAPANERWLDRLSVPYNDPSGAIQWQQSNNNAGLLSGIPAYQLFAEWPTLIVTRKTGDLADTTPADPTSASGKPADLGFVLDFPTYTTSPPKPETFSAFGMQIFRVPAGVTDPYQMSPAWQLPNAQLPLPYSGDAAVPDTGSHLGLNPVPLSPAVTTFFNGLVMGNVGSTPLAGAIQKFPLPYDPNDPSRTPLGTPSQRDYSGLISVFAYSEYLWSTVWAHPLVLNSARPDGSYSFSPGAFKAYRYSNPAFWPKASGISPDNSAFDLTPHGGGVFNAVAPVAVGGAAPSTGVGHFYWTAYTPSYSGDAGTGGVISRTWLADEATQQLPTSFPSGSATGDATVALGFMPPQDAIVDKRGRTASGAPSGSQLGGYRVTWYNPTKDAGGHTVPPDFWVVELVDGSAKSHFMLPGSYPAVTQSTTDLIMTDARTYLPSGNAPTAGPAVGDQVGPGYCWFDIPVELRPSGGAATLTVFGVKAILKNNPVAGARPLNRPDWMDAIKTATATIKVVAGSGTDLAYAHKIPFNYYWDIVVANGPATIVAP